jgi:hypothetical protein
MCFSSSCVIFVAFLKPGVLTGPIGDDQYLGTVRQFGDNNDAAALIRALASYCTKACFTSEASITTLEQQIAADIPSPCSYLHRGPIINPARGAHCLILFGISPSHVIVHDPLEKADLVNGTTFGSTARFCRYSLTNYGRCLIVEGEGSSCALLAEA